VRQPAHVIGSALVALAAQAGPDLRRRGDDHSALAHGQLLVGVEGKRRQVAAPAHLDALGVHGARRLARVLEHAQAGLRGHRFELRERRRVAEDVYRQQANGAVGHSGAGR
jgi:hypothetical protein